MLDDQINRLLMHLEGTGELGNTLVIFTSDNGPHREKGHDETFFNSSGGLKGFKRDLYEGGVRVPCIAYWNGKIRTGTTDHMAIFYDVMPTLAEVAGLEAPAQVDGISFLPDLLGQDQPSHPYLYGEEQMPQQGQEGLRQVARMGTWKAVRYGVSSALELYDLDADLFEAINVAEEHPWIVKEMNEILQTERVKTEHYP